MITNTRPDTVRPAFSCVAVDVEVEPAWNPSRAPYILVQRTDEPTGRAIASDRLTAADARRLAGLLLAAADDVDGAAQVEVEQDAAPTFPAVDVTGWDPQDVADMLADDEAEVEARKARTAAPVVEDAPTGCPAWCDTDHAHELDEPVTIDDEGLGHVDHASLRHPCVPHGELDVARHHGQPHRGGQGGDHDSPDPGHDGPGTHARPGSRAASSSSQELAPPPPPRGRRRPEPTPQSS